MWTLNPNIAFFFHPVTSQDRAHHECSRRCRAQCYRFFTFYTSVSSLITCVQLNLAMITVHFNYAKQRLDILKLLSMSDWRIGCRKQVKRGKQCLVGQFCQWNSYWRSLVITFGNEPKIVLQISWRPDTCGRSNSIRIRIVNTCGLGNFESAMKNLRIQNYLYTCRRERDQAIATPTFFGRNNINNNAFYFLPLGQTLCARSKDKFHRTVACLFRTCDSGQFELLSCNPD